MMTLVRDASPPEAVGPGTPTAITWIGRRKALIAAMSHEGTVSTCEFERGDLAEAAYLAQVVRLIGDRGRVVILGSDALPLALERSYVAIVQRPERLVEVGMHPEPSMTELVDRLRAMAA